MSHHEVCRAGCSMNPTQDELTRHHGTPLEFGAALWRAQIDGYVTAEEAVRGIRDYEREWCSASVGEKHGL